MLNHKHHFERLIPNLSGFPNELFIVEVCDDNTGFRVLLESKDNVRYWMKFKKKIIGYRNFDEGYRYRTKDQYGANCREWSIYKSNNTDFIDWLNSETFASNKPGEILHITILTQNDILEVLAFEEPIFEPELKRNISFGK